MNEEGKVAGRGALSLVRRAIDIWQCRSRWSVCSTFHVTYQAAAIHNSPVTISEAKQLEVGRQEVSVEGSIIFRGASYEFALWWP